MGRNQLGTRLILDYSLQQGPPFNWTTPETGMFDFSLGIVFPYTAKYPDLKLREALSKPKHTKHWGYIGTPEPVEVAELNLGEFTGPWRVKQAMTQA